MSNILLIFLLKKWKGISSVKLYTVKLSNSECRQYLGGREGYVPPILKLFYPTVKPWNSVFNCF